ncbi:unnamed protein product [Dicrocoelium dendriticum]|nr:unnamed protein product [Dicrocoelium dendriticum]
MGVAPWYQTSVLPRDDVYYDFHDANPDAEECCFVMPMELEKLEGMNVIDYLRSYTQINVRREQMYDRIYNKWSSEAGLKTEHILPAMREIVACDVTDGHVALIFKMVGIKPEEETEVDSHTFRLICAAAERVIFSKLLKEGGAPCALRPMLEIAEFQRFLRDYNRLKLRPELEKFLDLITI